MNWPRSEKAVLGIDHAKVAGELTNLWNFPETISVAIASHHDEVVVDLDVVAIQLGDYIANAAGLSDFTRTGDTLPPLSDQVIDCISGRILDSFVQELKDQGDDIRGFAGLF